MLFHFFVALFIIAYALFAIYVFAVFLSKSDNALITITIDARSIIVGFCYVFAIAYLILLAFKQLFLHNEMTGIL